MTARLTVPCRLSLSMQVLGLLTFVVLLPALAGCNRNQPAVLCAPLNTVTLVRVSDTGSRPRQFEINERYRIQALVDFANGRRDGFSARPRGLPTPVTSATFYDGSQALLTFSASPNLFSLSCGGYAGVQEANRVQIAQFEHLLTNQP